MEKRILKPGKGLYKPNLQATVTVNIRGKWCKDGGNGQQFEHREKQTLKIGNRPIIMLLTD